jgi:hypothetical protein
MSETFTNRGDRKLPLGSLEALGFGDALALANEAGGSCFHLKLGNGYATIGQSILEKGQDCPG